MFLNSFNSIGSDFIVFQRIDKKPIELHNFIHIAQKVNVLFCGCYAPTDPIDMKVMSMNGKSLLYLHYDTESG